MKYILTTILVLAIIIMTPTSQLEAITVRESTGWWITRFFNIDDYVPYDCYDPGYSRTEASVQSHFYDKSNTTVDGQIATATQFDTCMYKSGNKWYYYNTRSVVKGDKGDPSYGAWVKTGVTRSNKSTITRNATRGTDWFALENGY